MSHVQNDTRKIVKPKDITEGIARMMVLDLRPFDIVEGMGFNELFILVTNLSQLFRESRNFRVPVPALKKFRVLLITWRKGFQSEK